MNTGSILQAGVEPGILKENKLRLRDVRREGLKKIM